jgi:minor extracellular serine protease Vpr
MAYHIKMLLQTPASAPKKETSAMPNAKLENLLNLALAATETEMQKSHVLSTGYSPASKTWELIVKYHGPLERLESEVIHIEPLINGYAIATVREDFIDAFADLDEVEFVEKPKRLYFE